MRDVDRLKSLVTREALIAWLNDPGNWGTLAGVRRSPNYCPLANFIDYASNGKIVSVGYAANVGGEAIEFGTDIAKLPKWAAEFVRWVDKADHESITKQECLDFLFSHNRSNGAQHEKT